VKKVEPYLFFNGNCEEAFKFYESVLGAKIEAMMPHEGTPAADHTPPEWRKKILHARMKVGDTALMASDAPPSDYSKPQGFSISFSVESASEAERVFQALSEMGQVQMPMAETFWALRFGMLVDRFGIPWMINCDRPA
jgi:PhnB protein